MNFKGFYVGSLLMTLACGGNGLASPPVPDAPPASGSNAGAPASPAVQAPAAMAPTTVVPPTDKGAAGSPATPVAGSPAMLPPAAKAAGSPAVAAAGSGSTKSAGEVTGPAGFTVDKATGELIFRTEPLDLPAGEESYQCYGATLEEDVVIDGFVKTNQQYVHHAQFIQAILPEPEGKSLCPEQFKLTWMPIFLAGNGASELRFDQGIGHILPAGTQLVLQMHLFNATDKAARQGVEIRMHRSTSPNVMPVTPWAIGSSQIKIAPRQKGSASNVCVMNGGSAKILAVFPHMHMLGTKFNVEVGKSMDALKPLYLRDPYDFDDQRMEKMEINLVEGDILRVTCDYTNTTDLEVGFGESSRDEMCFFVGFALSDSTVPDCPNLWEALFTL